MRVNISDKDVLNTEVIIMEDKQDILNLLCETLQHTRDGSDVFRIVYDGRYRDMGEEYAIIYFEGGASRKVNIHLDSGCAMIRDVMKHI